MEGSTGTMVVVIVPNIVCHFKGSLQKDHRVSINLDDVYPELAYKNAFRIPPKYKSSNLCSSFQVINWAVC